MTKDYKARARVMGTRSDTICSAKIGKMVIEAYEKKDQANILEEEAVKLFERKLEEAAR